MINIDIELPLKTNHPITKGMIIWLKCLDLDSLKSFDLTPLKNHFTLSQYGSSSNPAFYDRKSYCLNAENYIGPNKVVKKAPGGNAPRSFFAWFKISDIINTGYYSIVSQGNINSISLLASMEVSVNPNRLYFHNGSGRLNYVTWTPNTNWNCLAIVYKGGRLDWRLNKPDIYLNGVSITPVINSHGNNWDCVPNNTFSLGHIRSYSSTLQFFRGLIDDVIVYDRVITANEVKYLYEQTKYHKYELVNKITKQRRFFEASAGGSNNKTRIIYGGPLWPSYAPLNLG